MRQSPAFCLSYLRSMEAMADSSAGFVLDRCAHLLCGDVLDIACGPSVACRRLAERKRCRLTALDLPEIITAARQLYGDLPDREWIGADFLEWEPTKEYDATFCGHFLEYAAQGETGVWLKRMANCVKTGGDAVFVSFMRESAAAGPTDSSNSRSCR